jgi:SAM-dependent methyltransferase
MSSKNSWHDDNLFWETFIDFMFTDDLLKGTNEEIDDLIELLEIPSNAEILDLGCGIGRHSLELSRRGFKVTGLDRTPKYLDVARKTARAESLMAEFLEGDMRSFVREDAFDYVINIFTSGLSYFEDIEEDKRVINNVYKSLRPGGKFIVHTAGKEILARIFQKRDWVEKDGNFLLQERNIEKDWSWMNNRWILIKDGQSLEYRVNHRVYSASELSELITDCDFKDVRVYGDLKGSPYDNKARRLVVVGCK